MPNVMYWGEGGQYGPFDVQEDVWPDAGLECIEGQARGDFLYHVRELLVSNDLLATKIVKDQGQFALAYVYANNAVRVAKSLEDAELQAAATYTRGCTKLEWGLFGTTQQGIFQIDRGKAKDAIRDFQAILQKTDIQQEGIHPQLQGFTMLQLSRAQSFFQQSVHESVSANTLLLADQAAEMVECHTIDDPYTRIIMTGTVSGLHAGGYHLIKAGIFNAAGFPGKAIAELQDLKKLTERTYGQDETRNQAWSDIVLAEAFLGLRRYEDAIRKAREALVACHHINSMQNVAIITDISSRIVASPYGKSHDVKELGEMLNEWYDITSERNSER